MTEHPIVSAGLERPGRWLVTCDHATNRVPDWVNGGDLGLPAADMARHIAFDPGALGVAQALAEILDSPMIGADFSRLVIDPNRGERDPTLVMQLYDGTIIPANRAIPAAGVAERLDRLWRPYHTAYETLAAARPDRAICAIHSFTPQLRAQPPRPWQIGILHAPADTRLALPLIAALRAAGYCVGDNEPYAGHLPGDSIDTHALRQGRANVLIELRNDLISTPESQREWAAILAPFLTRLLAELPR
ncbi:N-formylglutamate amidohydrolase [Phaeovulum vinaykumarii]|uniref:Predicted N-formylglutamate amidohydrolase n=1 Tax=Phaeovulum vinaykumarii TaxID=407234 RepID=A0A1N7MKS9_9RHOB|nr:N-formylglutamate amidohydrolase [Phaeovulum vinaykumarii]SIS86764.1 Predicted N-formylglutamate amidohydrolase [Phaeovulum vinaykumarii]SOC13433.1 predicted N-formylglutamate amidohydrolase [Phaeovulum vinaykumarii]